MIDILIFYIFCTYGMTSILLYGSIFDVIRPTKGFFGKLFKCPLCMSFHVGWFIALLLNLSNMFDINLNVFDIFMFSCISSGTSYILCMLFNDFGLNIKINKENSE